MKRTFYFIAVLALGITACNKNEIQTPAEEPAAPGTEAPVYHFSIPASLGNEANTKAVTLGESTITSTFANTDKVYVFIEGKGSNAGKLATSHNGEDTATYLTPSNINGTTCDLTGALKFYYKNNDALAPYTPAEGDVVNLYYNMTYPSNMDMSYFDYHTQNGSKNQDIYSELFGSLSLESQGASAYDFAMAKMKVTGVTGNGTDGYSLTMVQYDDETKSNVHFEKLGSMFHQRLTFTDKNGDAIAVPTINNLTVRFEGGNFIVGHYWPFSPYGPYYQIDVISISEPVISAEGDLYLALMFIDANKNRPLVLEATDNKGNVYSVTKAAPAGGFENGKYYYGSATLAWQKCILPTVTGTSATPVYGCFTITENPFNFTISGNSEGYNFELHEGHGGTITLDNLTASFSDYSPIIDQDYNDPNADVSLVLTGTNSITVDNSFWAILVYGNLKLSCTGTSATLTVTVSSDDSGATCGIQGHNYRSDGVPGVSFNEYNTTTELDVSSMLAATGYSVIRSARTDGPDNNGNGKPDFCTWTYTVTKTNP